MASKSCRSSIDICAARSKTVFLGQQQLYAAPARSTAQVEDLVFPPRYSTVNKNVIYNKASQAILSPRTVPFFLLVSLLDGYSFANVLVKGIVAFKH